MEKVQNQKLFNLTPSLPSGFKYKEGFVSAREEIELLQNLGKLPYHKYLYKGEFEAKRRAISFDERDLPLFLAPLRARAAALFQVPRSEIVECSIIQYPVRAAIGWHRDQPPYESVIGITLGGGCVFKLRPFDKGHIFSVELIPRSIYHMAGDSRTEYQHSILPVKEERYAITFRTLGQDARGP